MAVLVTTHDITSVYMAGRDVGHHCDVSLAVHFFQHHAASSRGEGRRSPTLVGDLVLPAVNLTGAYSRLSPSSCTTQLYKLCTLW